MGKPQEPDKVEPGSSKWDHFETWKGEPAPKLPAWFDKLLRRTFGLVILTAVFLISGTAAGLILSTFFHGGRGRLAQRLWDTDTLTLWRASTTAAWAGFWAGGIIGVLTVARWWRRNAG